MAEPRTCRTCGETYEDTPENFRVRKDGEKSARCVSCERERLRRKEAKERERAAAARAKALDRIETTGIDRMISAATSGGSNIPHSAELVESLMDYFGGTRGFAAICAKQYWECPPGGSQRTRMLESITRLISANTAEGGAIKPLDLMSEAELQAEVNRLIMQQALALQKGSVHGKVQASGPPAIPGAASAALPAPGDGGVQPPIVVEPSGGVGVPAPRSAQALPAD